ncbi:MAG: TonB-dependent receptor plug domain-containing protein [Pseudomonadales bacterium]|nr:TonB-dependent receptor plug domain-containing protein [Pseudomonadales bacterium]
MTHVRMKEEPVQRVPGSVTVITGEEIEETWRVDLEDLQGFVPGLIVDDLANTSQGAAIGLRGMGSNDVSRQFEPTVAMMIDGVYVGTHSGRMLRLFDMEQVEIARGLQGALNGPPSPGGTINLRRTRPTGELDVDTWASADQYNARRFSTRLNFPIVDSLAGKLTFDWARGGGEYMDNVSTDRGDENQHHRTAVSASLLWSSDRVDVQYTFDSDRDGSDTPALLNISTESDLVCINATTDETCGSILGLTIPQTLSIDATAQNFSNARTFEGDYHTLHVDFTLADHRFSSITGVRETFETVDQDFDATFVDFFSTSSTRNYDQVTQEFRLVSPPRETINYVVGAYFLDTSHDRVREDSYILNVLDDAGLTTPRVDGEIRRVVTAQDFNLQSWFANLDYTLNGQWTAEAGLRLDHLEKEIIHEPLGIRVNNPLPSPVQLLGRAEWNDGRANLGLRYKVDDNAMIWFRYLWDLRPGGFNHNAMSRYSGESFDTELMDGYEFGLKSEWFENHLRLNATVYKYQREDKTEEFARVVTGGRVESVIDNVATMDIRGSEIELEWAPIENLYVQASLSHISSDYDEYSIPDLTGAEDAIDLSGLMPSYAPRDSIGISARYSFPFDEGRIRAWFGYRYSSDYQTNPGVIVAKIGNFSTVDLSIDYLWKAWTFRLFGQNLNDKRYLQNAQNPTAVDIVSMAPGTTAPQPLVTFSEYNRPRLTGIQIIYRPQF